ncbi:MAG: 16S rRNA (cytidine(1402)-2'-O)-methyltransferase [Syntrophomonadaceae bacterium]|jgi:16S rRNA (cytidine1402-2'-O)-methyltransferase|nr:16S rRNA (cytidine(1402)-2'-O)-methyltransferase [Syntrophomonadaceae bacterium]
MLLLKEGDPLSLLTEERHGSLYLCATPIGNLEDITLRVLKVLKEVSLIAAEDTRHTRKLLSHYDIHTPLTSYHSHNLAEKGNYLLKVLREGKDVALVSDAGMPGISDPGHELIVQVLAAGLKVVPLPGPSAVITALVVAGFPTDRFCFEGFLPRKPKERRELLEKLKYEARTLVFYESPYRLISALQDMETVWGDRPLAIVRELTKTFEEVLRGDAASLLKHFASIVPRGEITIVVHGNNPVILTSPGEFDSHEVYALVAGLENQGKSRKEAIKDVARQLCWPKNKVYQAFIRHDKGE